MGRHPHLPSREKQEESSAIEITVIDSSQDGRSLFLLLQPKFDIECTYFTQISGKWSAELLALRPAGSNPGTPPSAGKVNLSAFAKGILKLRIKASRVADEV
ncbi:unnamed protein product [Ceratitis capitata]|uniref:(Mediterranean fruit fly) hypothetical protein n=1 Tax=Ceratitis capitata TaxID=7213 RepID=A0A811UR41_CERCA|nr:unnamed protein product [Ceratitis capitata]